MAEAFVPETFVPPRQHPTVHTVLVPLGPEHNEADYEAWMSSVQHIRATPGFSPEGAWPDPTMSIDDNLRDLEMHARHFADREGFTFTVVDRGEGMVVLGCVYVYPHPDPEYDARVRSWVRADRPELDREVWEAVREWIARDWPFSHVDYASR